MPALSLSTDISTLTACGNDYDYHDIFEKFTGIRKLKDALIAITTSGNSKNIINVLKQAKNENKNNRLFREGWWKSKKSM